MARLMMSVNGAGGPFTAQIAEIKADMANLEAFLDHVADTVVYPALARNYDDSGLKVHRGVVKAAVSKRGAKGNTLSIQGGRLSIGVDTGAVPESQYALDGRPAFRAPRGKTLRFWDDNGKPLFTKRVRASPPHEVFYLTEQDVTKIQDEAVTWIARGG
jgi:hypothetical protein